MASTSVFRSRLIGGPFQLLRAASRSSLIALAVALAALVSGILTYLAITGLAPYNPTPAAMVVLIVVDLSLVLALAGLIAWRLTRLWTERRSGAAGSKLHLRLVAMFSAIAVMPAILVAIFAAVSLNLGIEAWFSERVQTALANSVSVADAYVEEHKQVIRGDILAMADRPEPGQSAGPGRPEAHRRDSGNRSQAPRASRPSMWSTPRAPTLRPQSCAPCRTAGR